MWNESVLIEYPIGCIFITTIGWIERKIETRNENENKNKNHLFELESLLFFLPHFKHISQNKQTIIDDCFSGIGDLESKAKTEAWHNGKVQCNQIIQTGTKIISYSFCIFEHTISIQKTDKHMTNSSMFSKSNTKHNAQRSLKRICWHMFIDCLIERKIHANFEKEKTEFHCGFGDLSWLNCERQRIRWINMNRVFICFVVCLQHWF